MCGGATNGPAVVGFWVVAQGLAMVGEPPEGSAVVVMRYVTRRLSELLYSTVTLN